MAHSNVLTKKFQKLFILNKLIVQKFEQKLIIEKGLFCYDYELKIQLNKILMIGSLLFTVTNVFSTFSIKIHLYWWLMGGRYNVYVSTWRK